MLCGVIEIRAVSMPVIEIDQIRWVVECMARDLDVTEIDQIRWVVECMARGLDVTEIDQVRWVVECMARGLDVTEIDQIRWVAECMAHDLAAPSRCWQLAAGRSAAERQACCARASPYRRSRSGTARRRRRRSRPAPSSRRSWPRCVAAAPRVDGAVVARDREAAAWVPCSASACVPCGRLCVLAAMT